MSVSLLKRDHISKHGFFAQKPVGTDGCFSVSSLDSFEPVFAQNNSARGPCLSSLLKPQSKKMMFFCLFSRLSKLEPCSNLCSADHICFSLLKNQKKQQKRRMFFCLFSWLLIWILFNVHKSLLMSVCLLKTKSNTERCFLFFSAFLTWALFKYLPRWVRICFSAQMGISGIYVFLPLPSPL